MTRVDRDVGILIASAQVSVYRLRDYVRAQILCKRHNSDDVNVKCEQLHG